MMVSQKARAWWNTWGGLGILLIGLASTAFGGYNMVQARLVTNEVVIAAMDKRVDTVEVCIKQLTIVLSSIDQRLSRIEGKLEVVPK